MDGLLADVSKLEGAATGRRLLTSFERSAGDVSEAAGSFQSKLKEAVDIQSGSPRVATFEKLQQAADNFANGAMSKEQFVSGVHLQN